MNIASTNMQLEIARLTSGFIVIYHVDRGAGTRGITSGPVILKNEDELKAYLASLAKDVA